MDFLYFRKGQPEAAKVYNATLAKLRDLARDVAQQNGMPFANVHDAMISAMEQAQPALGEGYNVCGGDGFHPGPNGQLVMAYAFLKALQLDGQIGTITLDLQGKAEASPGHQVLSATGGQVDIESRRWPFCFQGDEKSPGGNRSILPYVPFNRDLNRFQLVVKNLDGTKAKVTWGAESKVFTKAELEQGVNLAEAFAANNPFSEPFRKLDELVSAKQAFETTMIKDAINKLSLYARLLPGDKDVEAIGETLRKKLFQKHEQLHAAVKQGVAPVRHTLTVSVEK